MKLPYKDVVGDYVCESSQAAYSMHLQNIGVAIRERFIGVIVTVNNIGFGPDGGGNVAIAVQGEYRERVQEMFPDYLVSALTKEEYTRLAPREEEIRPELRPIAA